MSLLSQEYRTCSSNRPPTRGEPSPYLSVLLECQASQYVSTARSPNACEPCQTTFSGLNGSLINNEDNSNRYQDLKRVSWKSGPIEKENYVDEGKKAEYHTTCSPKVRSSRWSCRSLDSGKIVPRCRWTCPSTSWTEPRPWVKKKKGKITDRKFPRAPVEKSISHHDVDDGQFSVAESNYAVDVLHVRAQEGTKGASKTGTLGLPVAGVIGTPDAVHATLVRLV